MSATAALKGYRTQFLYSLHFILSNLTKNFIFKLEGEEDLDVLDSSGQLLYAIQLKNLGKIITLSDILSENKTSFIKRFIRKYPDSIPILVSYGEIAQDLKKWAETKNSFNEKDKEIIKKYKLSIDEWKLVKAKIQFKEVIEEDIAQETIELLKKEFPVIDPIPTTGYILNWIQFAAEKRQAITSRDLYNKIEDFAIYLNQRIAIHEQYGLTLKPLHKVSIENANKETLEKEFYSATLTRYEHIQLSLDVIRTQYLDKVNSELKINNALIVKGASGQGKTALLYSYVHHYGNDMLSFELNIQQDFINTQKSIQAIAAITQRLDVPTIFVINVLPNSTEWLKIVKESAHLKQVKFLIAIRNEDWYRARAVGIEFEHQEIDLTLYRQEAETIYLNLHKRGKILTYSDFEEAWIKLGAQVPLLEFVYSITQGDSLQNRLKQQVYQIANYGSGTQNNEVNFLRVVCLADSLGARIDISRLDSTTDYQFIIEKLESEYLIKKSSDRKFIQGLHIVRSQILTKILFDEFFNRKEDYAFKCLSLIAEEDLYLFLLQLFHLEMLTPSQLIERLVELLPSSNWSTYASLMKAFIWAGIREYVEKNRNVIDECRETFGDSWYILMDFQFGSNFNLEELLDLTNAGEENRAQIKAWNSKLSPKTDIFSLVDIIFQRLEFPTKTPLTSFEWKSYGEVLFWLKSTPSTKIAVPVFNPDEYEYAYRALDCASLSKLMLGMHLYSPELDNIRKRYAQHFIQKIKEAYQITHLVVYDDEVSVHYIIDILNEDNRRMTNDFVVDVLGLLRSAFPDRKKFNSQGYGHKLQTLAVDLDETHKAIPIENLPLEEWININACILNLYEYRHRPKNWVKYCEELSRWEQNINEKIQQFNEAFTQLLRGSKTFAPTIPVLKDVLFKHSDKIKEPQSITDSLGIYGDGKRYDGPKNNREQLTKELHSKYEQFFKALAGFKSDIECFISQSAQTLASRIQLQDDKNHNHDENIERLSQTNLYNAIEKAIIYNDKYKENLNNINPTHLTKIQPNALLTSATLWKDFLTNNLKGEHSASRVTGIKSDFENRILKECKKTVRGNGFSIKYVNGELSNYKPILIINGDSPFMSLLGMREAYNIVRQSIGNPEYTGLKYLVLQLWFSNFYFIQTVNGRTINNQCNEFRLYTFLGKEFEDLCKIHLLTHPIDFQILENLRISSWGQSFPVFNEIHKTCEDYGKLLLLVDHFYDLRFFDEIDLDGGDKENLVQYITNIGLEIQQSFQSILDSLVIWLKMFPIDESTFLDSEEEQEYFKAIGNIKDNIFPMPKGDEENYEVVINMEIISAWIDRLKVCTESWAIFIVLLYGKCIELYKPSM